jgi:hypothetical protein
MYKTAHILGNGNVQDSKFGGKYPDTKILLVSGNAYIGEFMQNATVTGYNFAVLTKPVHPKELLRTVRTLLDEKVATALVC